jgi:chromosome partitioning protein
MEERESGNAFFCSQSCLETSQRSGVVDSVHCDGCGTGFEVSLVSQVLYLKGQRKYACGPVCREQLTRELYAPSLGEMVATPEPPPVTERCAANVTTSSTMLPPPPSRPSDASARRLAPMSAAVAVPLTPAPPSVAVRATGPAVAVPLRAVSSNQTPAPAPVAPTPSVTAGSQDREPIIPGFDLPKRIAVFNHKGGTGKTTTSVSLAAGLAQKGKRVLLVDTDAQGNVAVSLGVKAEKSLYHVLVMGLAPKDAIVEVRPNLDLLPSNETLAAAELFLAGRQERDRVLSKRLASILDAYDHVIVDCSPSLSLMNQNALCMVDSVLVPVACDYLSLVGMRQVIKTVKSVNQLLHHPVRIWGVLPTFYDARANICREAVDTLKQHFGARCLRPVRQAIKVKEAPTQGQTIFEYAAGSAPAEDYAFVVDAVLGEVAYEEATQSHPEAVAASA